MLAIFQNTPERKIVFDNFVSGSEYASVWKYDSVWTEICPHCHEKYKDILGQRCSGEGETQGICGVQGCNNEANYYVDFEPNDIKFTEG